MEKMLRSRLESILSSKSDYIQWYFDEKAQHYEPVYIVCKNEILDNYICRDMNGDYFNFEASQLLSYDKISVNFNVNDNNENRTNELIVTIDHLLNGLIKTLAQTSLPQPKKQWINANNNNDRNIVKLKSNSNNNNNNNVNSGNNKESEKLCDIYKKNIVLHKLESKRDWFFNKKISFNPTSNIEYHIGNDCKLMGLWVDKQYFHLTNLKQIYYIEEPYNPELINNECLSDAKPIDIETMSKLVSIPQLLSMSNFERINNNIENINIHNDYEMKDSSNKNNNNNNDNDNDLSLSNMSVIPAMPSNIQRQVTDVTDNDDNSFDLLAVTTTTTNKNTAYPPPSASVVANNNTNVNKLKLELEMQTESYNQLNEAYMTIQEKYQQLKTQFKSLNHDSNENSKKSRDRTSTSKTSDEWSRVDIEYTNLSHSGSSDGSVSVGVGVGAGGVSTISEEIKGDLETLQNECKKNRDEIRRLKKIEGQYNLITQQDGEREKSMQELRKEYLLRNPNSFTIDNVFPSLEEILSTFSNIKDNEHRNCYSEFTKNIKAAINEKNKTITNKSDKLKFNKKYYTQLSYKNLFDSLLFTFNLIEKHKIHIYDTISNLLNTKHAILDDLKIETETETDSKMAESNSVTNEDTGRSKKENEMLEYLFHKYLMNHYQTVLTNDDKNSIVDKVINEYLLHNNNDESFNEMWSMFDEDMKNKSIEVYRKYIEACCQVCWIMVLFKPQLSIYPTSFWFGDNKVTFDEQYHKRIFGSDKNCDTILYVKYPAIKQDNALLSMKIDVVTAHAPFEK